MKKAILFGTIVVSALFMGMTNVSAKDYTITALDEQSIREFVYANQENVKVDGGTYTLTLTADDTLYVIDQKFVGSSEEYLLQLSEGAEVALSLSSNSITVSINKGTVSTIEDEDYVFYTRKFINGGEDVYDSSDDTTYPMNFVVAEGATFDVRCELIMTKDVQNGTDVVKTPATFTNNGTVNFDGNVTVENGAVFDGTGTNNVAAQFTFEDGAETNLVANLTLKDGAQVVANTDITDKITNSDDSLVYDKENNTFATLADYSKVNALKEEIAALEESDYTAESWKALQEALALVEENLDSTKQATVDGYADAISNALQGLEYVITVDPGEDEGNLGDGNTPEEDTTTPSEDVPEVPQTFDSLITYVSVGVVSISLIAGAVLYIKKKQTN